MEKQSNRKRTHSGPANDQTHQARKKAKMKHARTIHTQNFNPQHSKLPKFLDVEKFISSRAFEIGAMERSMKLSRDASGKRSFQTLPRHLRRRAASHFVRRVPTKLRPKARFEMKNDKPKVLSKAVKRKLSLKKHKNCDRTKTLLKRQVEKKWLKTHIWHAKRTKMIDLWGFRLAKTPTEKCFRPTYRAARHGFTLHDLSYYTHLNLTAEEDLIKQTLKMICDPTGVDPCSLRFIPGHRAAEVNLYSHQGWPYSLVGPATLLWRPISDATSSFKGPLLNPSLDVANTQSSNPSPSSGSSTQRTVLLQIHPSIKASVTEAIGLASQGKVLVEELVELGCLELGGPRCLEMMGRVLTGNQEPEKREVETWLDAGFKPHVIPMGMIVGLTVDDPRLKFPPKKKKKSEDLCPLQAKVIQPVIRLAKCGRFWDRSQMQKKVNFKKSDLDRRRAMLDVPGSELPRTEEDDQISILLVRVGGGWRMILPNNWTKAFFHSFIFSSARLVCLDQRAQIDFEAGRPSFPRDYPTLLPATELADQHGSEEARYWASKPPAKRVNFKLVQSRGGEGGDPFVPDWNVVIGQKGIQRNGRAEVIKEALESETTQDEPPQPWLLIGPLVGVIVENVQKLADSTRGTQSLDAVCGVAFELIDRIIKKLKADLEWNQMEDNCKSHQLDSGLVRVKLFPSGKDGKGGVLQPLARLYWNRNKDENPPKNSKGNKQTEFIGLITTGSFRLTNGSSIGFGAISLRKLIPMIISQQWMNAAGATAIRQDSDGQGVTENKQTQKRSRSIQISYRNKNRSELEPARVELVD
ncbi:hypothetical protein PGTUg99_022195 [Puccinia graminis f. sp. tritici]|uniref:Uncharacterized protein n=1 Tax=Puccinia graminis f. sp. tritici TaxID=56615 RepID=A0A5B0NJ50_PUCGR|nr:hypothetical protein PGTUg99_022195 [Puccinia graminis f. sp. tritici]